MSEGQGVGQPSRYCGKCGVPVRPGTNFCPSCGERLGQEVEEPEVRHHHEVEDPDDPKLPRKPWVSTGRINDDSSGPNLRLDHRRVLERIKNLPIALKIVGVVVGALLLFTVLSPLGLIAAAILFGSSLIGLIVRVAQRRFPKWWGIAVVSSLVLMFVFASISDVVYGTAFLERERGSSLTTSTQDSPVSIQSNKGWTQCPYPSKGSKIFVNSGPLNGSWLVQKFDLNSDGNGNLIGWHEIVEIRPGGDLRREHGNLSGTLNCGRWQLEISGADVRKAYTMVGDIDHYSRDILNIRRIGNDSSTVGFAGESSQEDYEARIKELQTVQQWGAN